MRNPMAAVWSAVIVALATVMALATPAAGQCDGQWLYGPDQGMIGTDGNIYATMRWDPDGPGPQAELLVAAGEFAVAGQTLASNIAVWDGAAWQALGSGTNGRIRSLAIHNGDLVAGGEFTIAGGVSAARIARWNGTEWRSIGDGVSGPVYAIAEYNSDLVVAGTFRTAGGTLTNNIARWNGTAWSALGEGLRGSGSLIPVRALCVYNGDLVAGGAFQWAGPHQITGVARWDGGEWLPVGERIGYAYAFVVHNEELIAAGSFVGETPGLVSAAAKWNGASWQLLGLDLDSFDSESTAAYAVAVYNDEIVVGGAFWATISDGNYAINIAKWDGAAWQRVGLGSGKVKALSVFGGRLVAGFGSEYSYSHTSTSIQAWDGSAWNELGRGIGIVMDLASYDGDLIAAGVFETAGVSRVNHIARWAGTAWAELNAGGSLWGTYALTVYNGDLIAGAEGPMFDADGSAAAVSRWEGSFWRPVGTGLAESAAAFNLAVHDGALFASGYLFIGGDGTSYSVVAQLGGDDVWSPLGSGMSNTHFANDAVNAMISYGGDLIAAGDFNVAGGIPANKIARWNGVTWQPLGPGMEYWVYALAVYNGDLFAGGYFSTAGGAPAAKIARWDGSAWHPVGGGMSGVDASVRALAVYNGELVAAGRFSAAGGVPANNIARWDGSNWRPMGAGITGSLSTMTVHHGQLILGGSFSTAGGQVSAHWARWAVPSADFNHDGDPGTDADIEAFFACLAGNCCPACGSADFDADGDVGTDADIEAFFRVLGGGAC